MKRTPLKRKKGLRCNSYADAVARLSAPLRRKPPRNPYKPKARQSIGPGRKTREWQAAWREIKPTLERRGITHCELRLTGCTPSSFLTPAHSKKRRNITTPEELREVVIACVNCHSAIEILPEAEMARIVRAVIAARST